MGWPKTKPSTDTGLVRGGAAIGAPGAPTTWEERNLETPEKGNHSRLVPLFFQKTSLERSSTIPDLQKLAHFFDFRIWGYLELKQGKKLGEQVLIAQKKEMISWKKFNIPPTSSLPEKS